tara:strand:+ start:182 stop:790 length:609 start_codon:yes stop_codon:yes gene_type:complete
MVGIAIASPPGPGSLLCIQTALEQDKKSVTMLLFGAAFAHMFYSIMAVSGFVMLETAGYAQSIYFHWIAAALMLLFAVQSWQKLWQNNQVYMEDAATSEVLAARNSMYAQTLFAFVFYLSNPMTIFGFMSFYAAFGLHPTALWEVCTVVVATVIGSSAWRYLLVQASLVCRHKLLAEYMVSMRLFCACVMSFFAVCALYKLV